MKFGVRKFFRSAAAILLAAVTVTAGSLTAFADNAPDFNVEVNAPPKITFLGDSITAGYGLDGYTSDDTSKCASYANILTMVFESMLPEEAEFESQNLAKNGLTSAKMLKNLKEGLYDKALADADAVVVSIGGNDMLGVLFDLLDSDNSFGDVVKQLVTLDSELDKSLEPFPDNLSSIADEIHSRAHKESCKLFIQTLYNPFEDYAISALDKLSSEKIARLNETIFEKSDSGENYIVADVAAAFEGRNAELTNISSIDIHPNADGHALIAKTLEPLIEEQTYTYYDHNAVQAYKLECEQQRQEENERKMTAVYIAVAAAALIAVLSVISIITTNKKRRAK